jgi:copper chaperone CopZ
MAEFTLAIDGMHCGACVRRVGQALSAVEGVTVNEVRVGAARLTAVEPATAAEAAIAAVNGAGFTARLQP